jgi:hypothetical protein
MEFKSGGYFERRKTESKCSILVRILTRLSIKLFEYNSQSMGLGHILSMRIQNNWEDKIIIENYQIQPSSFYIDNLKPSNNNYSRCIPDSMGSNIPNSVIKYKDTFKHPWSLFLQGMF